MRPMFRATPRFRNRISAWCRRLLKRSKTPGNINLVAVGWNDATSTVVSVTDSMGNVYSPAHRRPRCFQRIESVDLFCAKSQSFGISSICDCLTDKLHHFFLPSFNSFSFQNAKTKIYFTINSQIGPNFQSIRMKNHWRIP